MLLGAAQPAGATVQPRQPCDVERFAKRSGGSRSSKSRSLAPMCSRANASSTAATSRAFRSPKLWPSQWRTKTSPATTWRQPNRRNTVSFGVSSTEARQGSTISRWL
jgi:hypothetical protein